MWSSLYWQKAETGSTAGAGTFAFSRAEMNSPVFNPLRATRPTLEAVGSVSAAACDSLGGPFLDNSPEGTALRSTFKTAMLDSTIATNAVQNPNGTYALVSMVLGAPAGSSAAAYWNGNTLVSVNVPLKTVNKATYYAAVALNTSQASQNIIATLLNSTATWASNAVTTQGGVSEWQHLITGQPSRADLFAATVEQYIGFVNTSGNMSVQKLLANFGVYGELPIIAVRLDDCFVLLDPLSGALSGPFAPTAPLNATGLLSAYPNEYAPNTGVAYYTTGGCPTNYAASWVPVPGNVIPPGWTRTPAAPPTFPIPGRPTKWNCTQAASPPIGSGDCECTMQETFVPPAPWPTITAPGSTTPIPAPPTGTPSITVRTNCNFGGGCTGAGTPGLVNPQPSGPGGGPPVLPVPAPGSGNVTCTHDIFIWW